MTKYVAPGAGYIKIYHEDQDCETAGKVDLVPVEEAEIPDSARGCCSCSDGIDAREIKQVVSHD